MDRGTLFNNEVQKGLEQILIENQEVFKDEQGKLTGAEVTLNINQQAHPAFSKLEKYLTH